MLGRVILGLIMVAAGFMLVWKAHWFVINVGRIGWFEQHMSTFGGSWLAYKLIGLIIILAGLLTISDLQGEVADAILSPLFKRGSL